MENKELKYKLDEIEASNVEIPIKKRKRVSAKSNKKIYFEEDINDSDLMSLLKTAINESDVVYQALYDMFGRAKATNMINGINKGQLSWDRFKEWLSLIGKQPGIVIKDTVDDKNK